MYPDVLVGADIDAAEALLALLDRHDFVIDTAYWYRLDEGEWRLALVPRHFESLRSCYERLYSFIDEPDFPDRFKLNGPSFQRASDPMVKAIEKAAAGSREEIVCISRVFAEGIYIEEAVVLRWPDNRMTAA